jgi:6-pyruvoyl-tetrahydropterin synthase
MKIWEIKKYGRMILTQLHKMKKRDNGSASDFDERFDKLVKEFPNNLKPSDDTNILHYTNAFDGQIVFMIRGKSPTTLEIAKEIASKIEENLSSSKVVSFNTSRASTSKGESKKVVINTTHPTLNMMQ